MSSFEDNLKINLYNVQSMEQILREYCNDGGILEPVFIAAKKYLEAGGKPFLTRMSSKKYLLSLKEFDALLIASDYTPTWQYYEEEEGILHFDPELVNKTFDALKLTGELFYFYVMVVIYIGGSLDEGISEYFAETLKDILTDLKVFVTARKMEKEFSSQDVKKAANYTHLVEPVDISGYPTFLTENKSSIIRRSGKYYLTVDIIKALTAAGGVAQALERQDLEGGVTNAANKQSPTRSFNGDPDDVDGEGSTNSKTSA